MAAWIKMPLGMELGLASGDYVLDMNAAPSPKRRRSPPPKKNVGPCSLGPNGWMDQDGTRHDLSPVDFVLHGDPAPSQEGGRAPKFSAHVYCGQTAGWITMALGMEVGLSPGDFVLDGTLVPSPNRGRLPNFWPIFIVAKRLDASRCQLVRRYASAQATLC